MNATWTLSIIFSFAFVSCLNADPTPATVAGTGIEGVIMISPIHPGPIREGVPDSKPLPNAVFTVQSEKGEAATFTTDTNGKFRVSVPPGHYTVSLQGRKRGVGSFGPFDVEVVAGKMTKVKWECDTGIR
jgi:hypothetical protein